MTPTSIMTRHSDAPGLENELGFKADTSFLRYLSMGVLGTKQTMRFLEGLGYRPIELERYCASNKIWTTKVKRLRLPDLLCARTGMRIEVRTKSDLKIRMSDAPTNPDRRWDSGLRDEDLCAFIRCSDEETGLHVAESPVMFSVQDLRATVDTSILGLAKSASEGAERDRTWPSTVVSKSGEVVEVSPEKIVVLFDGGRRQSYQMRGKIPYVGVRERVIAEETMIAGTARQPVKLPPLEAATWNPLADLQADNPIDRFASAKALPYADVDRTRARGILEQCMVEETDERVALEQAGSAAKMGSLAAAERLAKYVWNEESRPDLRMESVFILTEVATPDAVGALSRIAAARDVLSSELRQAAIWGLGKAGAKDYREVVPFIHDPDEDVALHAIVALGSDVAEAEIDKLIDTMFDGSLKARAAACAALKAIGSEQVVFRLVQRSNAVVPDKMAWIIATLGGLPVDAVRAALTGNRIMEVVAPLLLLHPQENWIASRAVSERLEFLVMQNLY